MSEVVFIDNEMQLKTVYLFKLNHTLLKVQLAIIKFAVVFVIFLLLVKCTFGEMSTMVELLFTLIVLCLFGAIKDTPIRECL